MKHILLAHQQHRLSALKNSSTGARQLTNDKHADACSDKRQSSLEVKKRFQYKPRMCPLADRIESTRYNKITTTLLVAVAAAIVECPVSKENLKNQEQALRRLPFSP